MEIRYKTPTIFLPLKKKKKKKSDRRFLTFLKDIFREKFQEKLGQCISLEETVFKYTGKSFCIF